MIGFIKSLRTASATARLGVSAAYTGRVPALDALRHVPKDVLKLTTKLPEQDGWKVDREKLAGDWKKIESSLTTAMSELDAKNE